MFKVDAHHEGLERGRLVPRADQPVRVLGRALLSDQVRRPRQRAARSAASTTRASTMPGGTTQ